MAFWLPSFMLRSFKLTMLETSLAYSALLFFGGFTGIWVGGVVTDKLVGKRPGAYAFVPAIAFLLSIPFYAAAVLAQSAPVAFVLCIIPQALGLMWLGPIISGIQQLVGPNMRATASAAFLFVNNLIGLGLGTAFFGIVSDVLTKRFGDEALRYAILSGLIFYVISAAILLLTTRRLKKDLIA